MFFCHTWNKVHSRHFRTVDISVWQCDAAEGTEHTHYVTFKLPHQEQLQEHPEGEQTSGCGNLLCSGVINFWCWCSGLLPWAILLWAWKLTLLHTAERCTLPLASCICLILRLNPDTTVQMWLHYPINALNSSWSFLHGNRTTGKESSLVSKHSGSLLELLPS